MPLNSLQDESDLCLTITRPVEAVFDKGLAEFDVLGVSAPGQNRSHPGEYAGVCLPSDLVIKTRKNLVELIRRDEADESANDVILDHTDHRREFIRGEPARLHIVVTAKQEWIYRRHIKPSQGRERLREPVFRFDIGVQQTLVVKGGSMKCLEQFDRLPSSETLFETEVH
jgi:hypothetical protein